MALPLEVDRPHEVHFVELVGGPGLRAGVLLPWWQRGEADPGAVKPWRCSTRSMVRSQGSGRIPRAFNSARMEAAPVKQ